jgi:hypothetical protein
VLSSLLGSGVVLAGGGLNVLAGSARTASMTHARLLDLAATAEALSVTLYTTVLGQATFHIEAGAHAQLRALLGSELDHLNGVASLGGAPLRTMFTTPAGLLTDASAFVRWAQHLERSTTEFYLAATHQLALQGNADLAAKTAALAASEAQHAAAINFLAGLPSAALAQPVTAVRGVGGLLSALTEFTRPAGNASDQMRLPVEARVREVVRGSLEATL